MFSIMARPAAVAINLFGTLKLAWAVIVSAAGSQDPAGAFPTEHSADWSAFAGPPAPLSWNCEQHLALPIDALAVSLRRGGSSPWAMLRRSASMILRTF